MGAWATAMFAGLRRGELRALRWSCVEAGVIRVERKWDDAEGELDGAKSKAGVRCVPLIPELRQLLLEHKLRTGGRDDALVFAREGGEGFVPSTVRREAIKAWEAAGLQPIALHECRHTFASLMIAAGVNVKALSERMGRRGARVGTSPAGGPPRDPLDPGLLSSQTRTRSGCRRCSG